MTTAASRFMPHLPEEGLAASSSLRERSRQALRTAFELASEQLDREHELPVPNSPETLRQELELALAPEGRPMEEVVGKLRRILAATPSSANPRFLNQLFGGRDPVAMLADMLVPLINTSMYTYKVAAPQVLMEREVVGRMAEKVGYADGEGILCPGGSISNLLAMLVARNESAEGVREQGLRGERLAVYTSCVSHYSIRKNAGILGLGRSNVREVPTDGRGRMDVDALRRQIHADRKLGFRPILINATAGTTVLVAFDPFRSIADVARQEGIWMHVDGAVGGSVLLCESHRELVDGVELSDSFTWNAHKLMGVPQSCSALLVRRPGLLSRHLREAADYLFQAHSDELNPGTRSLQCGRRNDAMKLWAAWQLHGDRGYDERLRHLFELARYAAERIDEDPDLELTRRPESVAVCFEVRGRRSEEICDRLYREGRLLISHGLVDGRCAIRLACVNPDLQVRDIDDILGEIKAAAGP
jgi:sulfinoalanine decarboxylase/sulfinoalanine decarboxylase/aspartate 1-decarboxylase